MKEAVEKFQLVDNFWSFSKDSINNSRFVYKDQVLLADNGRWTIKSLKNIGKTFIKSYFSFIAWLNSQNTFNGSMRYGCRSKWRELDNFCQKLWAKDWFVILLFPYENSATYEPLSFKNTLSLEFHCPSFSAFSISKKKKST